MATLIENARRWVRPRGRDAGQPAKSAPAAKARDRASSPQMVRVHAEPPVDIAPNDPIVAYFLSAPGAVEIDKLRLDSPALRSLQRAGVQLVIPLVSQGELVGLLNLGPRLSQQDYSTYDRGLLNDLATQAAPAVRVAQLVRQQQAEARDRERIEHELRVARLIQQTLLPKDLPALTGWKLASYYQPAREVGGDFYDFLYFEDGRLGVVIGDVTDKGVPAALVMATTRSILRAAAQNGESPGQVLERTNELLCPDIPPKMFVTCLYAILDPATGRLQFANAGHDLPYQRKGNSVIELRATGMPLGLMPAMRYEERETTLDPGDEVLFYSDGLVEAHNTNREMFSFPHLMSLMGERADDTSLIDFLLAQLTEFTGPDWEQEDDVTLVTLRRSGGQGLSSLAVASPAAGEGAAPSLEGPWQMLDSWQVPSAPGNERAAMLRVADALRPLDLPPLRLEHLTTAVAEATMNAMEHGNHYEPDAPVELDVRVSDAAVMVRIRDQGGTRPIPAAPDPDLEAKLAEEQTPRGWGLFLIKHLVDEMRVASEATRHTVELILYREQA